MCLTIVFAWRISTGAGLQVLRNNNLIHRDLKPQVLCCNTLPVQLDSLSVILISLACVMKVMTNALHIEQFMGFSLRIWSRLN